MKTNKECKKGTGKAIGFEGCNKELPVAKYNKVNFKYGLGISCGCYAKWLDSYPGRDDIIASATLRGKKRADKEQKQQDKKKKEENKSIDQLIQETRRPFQKLIRIRDHGQDCICCHRPLPFNIGDYDAGHFLKAELYTGLIFHPDNVNGQLVYCNKHSHGNESAYSDGLKVRIGKGRFNTLQNLKLTLKYYKWSRDELNKMKKYYNYELKLVEKGLKNISDVDFSIGIKQ